MRVRDILLQTAESMNASKVRSALTILGIVIGISAVIVMLSIGQGAQQSVAERIQSFGTNVVTISPGSSQGFSGVSSGSGSADSLTEDDVALIEKYIPGIAQVSPSASDRYQIIYKDQNDNTTVTGIDDSYRYIYDLELQSGSFFSEENVLNKDTEVVIGSNIVEDFFGNASVQDILGSQLRIEGLDFTLIGVLDEVGRSTQDDGIFVPVTTLQHYLQGSDFFSPILVKVTNEENIEASIIAIEDLLRASHNIDRGGADDFSVSDSGSFLETAQQVTNTFTILLGSVAGISLVVGGIGIMNMMLTIVAERKNEIGLRKAVGAKERDINLQFLVESTVLTFFGGVIGVVLGVASSTLIASLGIIETIITTQSIVLALGVSSLIGISFGYYPAQRAAKLDPIDALRSE